MISLRRILVICLFTLCCATVVESGYRADGSLELAGQSVHNPSMDVHRNPHMDQHSAQNRLLMSISATAVSNSGDPNYVQAPLSTLQSILQGSMGSGRSAAFLYLDQNPYSLDPNRITYNQILSDATASGYSSVLGSDGISYLARPAAGSDSSLTGLFFNRLPGSVIFQAAKDPAGGGVAAVINQSAEAVAHLRQVSGSNMFMHLIGGNTRTNTLDSYLGSVMLDPKHNKKNQSIPVFQSSRQRGGNVGQNQIAFPTLTAIDPQSLYRPGAITPVWPSGTGSQSHTQAHNGLLSFSPAEMFAIAQKSSSNRPVFTETAMFFKLDSIDYVHSTATFFTRDIDNREGTTNVYYKPESENSVEVVVAGEYYTGYHDGVIEPSTGHVYKTPGGDDPSHLYFQDDVTIDRDGNLHGALCGRRDNNLEFREKNDNWSSLLQKSDELKAEKASNDTDDARSDRLGSGMGEPGDSSWGR